MEKDEDWAGAGNGYTTDFRLYDPRLGRWLSVDPSDFLFPYQSPFIGLDNNPIMIIDPLGLAGQGGGNSKCSYCPSGPPNSSKNNDGIHGVLIGLEILNDLGKLEVTGTYLLEEATIDINNYPSSRNTNEYVATFEHQVHHPTGWQKYLPFMPSTVTISEKPTIQEVSQVDAPKFYKVKIRVPIVYQHGVSYKEYSSVGTSLEEALNNSENWKDLDSRYLEIAQDGLNNGVAVGLATSLNNRRVGKAKTTSTSKITNHNANVKAGKMHTNIKGNIQKMGFKSNREAQDFFGWKDGYNTKTASDFTKDQLIKQGITKQNLMRLADDYQKIANLHAKNPSAQVRANQLIEIIMTHFKY